MKHLPFKLGIAVVLLFSAVIATCLLWMPVKIRYYTGKFRSENPKERVAGVEGLIGMGKGGKKILIEYFSGNEKEAEFLFSNWRSKSGEIDCHTKTRDGEIISYKTTVIHEAARRGFTGVIGLVLISGIDIELKDKSGRTPLHAALGRLNVKSVAYLISRGADVNAEWQSHPLLLSVVMKTRNYWMAESVQEAKEKGLAIAELLIKAGADVNKGYRLVGSPATVAAGGRVTPMLELLLKNGASVNGSGNGISTPLHGAADSGRLLNARLLLKYGANVNTLNSIMQMPLHNAASGGWIEVAMLLLENGTEVNIIDKYDDTPLDLAIQNGKSEMASLIREYGGKMGWKLKSELKAEQNKK